MPWNDDLAQNSPAYGIAADESTRIRTIAGPGTGKSFSMRRRVARLIESGVLPGRILAITFTRIAAEDIGRELHALDVDGADQVDARTLHSLAMSILRRQHVIQALGRHTRPMGQFQVQPLLHDLSPNFGTKNRREERVGEYEAAFALNQDDDPLDCEDESDADFRNHLVAWLRFHKAMLIGELVPFLYAYLRDNPSAPELTEYDHILVDEYQDLNKVEQGCIELLGTHANVMIVGDDNQSIYSFKHAHPEGIAQWANNHEDLTDHALDHCYRCPRKIVSIANNLISHNPEGLAAPLEPIARNGEGVVRSVRFQTTDDEATGIAADIVQKVESGTAPGDILVLSPRKKLGMKVADLLREADVPFREYLGESALQSPGVVEKLAILMLLADRDDRPAFRWLLGYPSSNFRTGQYARLRAICEEENLRPWDAMEQISTGELVLPHGHTICARFEELRARILELDNLDSSQDLLDALFPPDDEQFTRIRELVAHEIDEDTTVRRLKKLILERIYEPDFPADATYVRIMTLHGSKGLGTPIVYLTSLVQGLIPRRPDGDDDPEVAARKLQEQRRLFYVALTRVKSVPNRGLPGELILSGFRQYGYSEAFNMNAGQQTAIASQFLRELGPDTPQTTAA